MTPLPLYDLADARARARRALRDMTGTHWTIGDPFTRWLLALSDIRRARRALRAAGHPIPPARITR